MSIGSTRTARYRVGRTTTPSRRQTTTTIEVGQTQPQRREAYSLSLADPCVIDEPPVSIAIIFNPQSGRGHARRRLNDWLARWGGEADVLEAQAPGHATELAAEAAQRGCRIVAAAGGDGTVHEVANGLLATNHGPTTLAVIPIGSANDYGHTLLTQFGAKTLEGDDDSAVDVGVIRGANGNQQFFVESVGVGLSGRITVESRKVGRQGLTRYAVAALRALRRDISAPELRLVWDDDLVETMPTLIVSLLLGRREGNFPLAPCALLDDGLFDFVHAGPLTRWQVLRLLPRLAVWGPPNKHPSIRLGQCRSLQITAGSPLVIHTDGEMFCTSDDNVSEVEVRLLPQVLRAKVAAV